MTAEEIAEQRLKAARKEKNKLNKLLKPVLDDDTFKVAESLIENIAFLKASLTELREAIRMNGFIETYDNGGGQRGTKDSTYLKAYNTTLKNFNTTWRQLLNMVPKEARGDVDDGFDAF